MTWDFYPASRFDEHASEWDALNAVLYDSHPLLDSRFVGCLVRHFGTPKDVLAVRTEGSTPNAMTLVRPVKWGIWQSFLPAQAQIAPSLIPDADTARSLAAQLPKPTRRLDLLCQDEMYSPWSFVPGDMTATEHAVTIAVTTSGCFPDYWDTRPKNLRKNVAKWRNRISKDGRHYQLVTHSATPGLTEALRRYSQIELQGWKGKAGTAIDISQPQGLFYSDVIDRFSRSGDAKISELLIDDMSVASRLTVQSERTVVILKTTYDESFAKYAPGRMLLYCLLEKIYGDNPGVRVEFYTNASQEQIAWATEQRTIRHISAYRSTVWRNIFNLYSKINDFRQAAESK